MTARPTATREHMPFAGHRTVAEVRAHEERPRVWRPRDLTDRERMMDAINGSAKLRVACLRELSK